MVYSWEVDDPSLAENMVFEDEVLVIRSGEEIVFNFPRDFYERYLKRMEHMISPLRKEEVEDPTGGSRVVVSLRGDSAQELAIWLALNMPDDYFLTEIEEVDLLEE